MKKNQPRKRPQQKNESKKLKKELIITLSNGKKFDFFKLPNEMRESLLVEIPSIRDALKDFKGL